MYGTGVQWKASLDTRSVNDEAARDRIRHQSLRSTYPIYFHVRRTAEIRQQFGIVRDVDLVDPFLREYLLWFLTAIAGKTRQLDTLFIARQWNSPGSEGVSYTEAAGDWLGRMLAPTWSSDFTKFLDVTAGALAARDGLSPDAARRWVLDSYRMLAAPPLLEDVVKERTASVSRRLFAAPSRRRRSRCAQAAVASIERFLRGAARGRPPAQ